jgi:hypothetical protein
MSTSYEAPLCCSLLLHTLVVIRDLFIDALLITRRQSHMKVVNGKRNGRKWSWPESFQVGVAA